MKITRRQFGGFAAAVPLASAVAAPVMRDPDVVIVGAGIAGIAAAQTLINGGRRVQVIEASPRIGGRCFTDTATFGSPFDRGATWLRSADRNPITGLARLHGFEVGARAANEILFANGSFQPKSSGVAYERAFFALSDAMGHAAEQDVDISGGDVTPFLLDDDARAWSATASAAIGPLDMGVDLKQMSVKDWYLRQDDEPNRMVRQGLGTLVARLALGMPVAVNTPAQKVLVLRDSVRVDTNRGAMTAKAAIVTASVGVLAAGGIGFDPPFDAGIQGALSGLQMGLISKIAMQFAPGSSALKFGDDTVLIPQVSDERGHYFLIRPFGAPLVICLVGGSLAWDLSTQLETTIVAFARDRLRAVLGAKADQGFRSASATDWGTNPFVRGSYATAKPGEWRVRSALEAPLGGRVFLAGEAQGGKNAQTVHGAYGSGQRAARRVLQLLKT